MTPLQIDTALVDAGNPVIADQIAAALRDSGMFYRDSEGGWLHMTERNGSHYARRLLVEGSAGEAAKDSGLLSWVYRDQRGERPHLLAYQKTYDKWLHSLPERRPELFSDWPKAEGVFALPAVVTETKEGRPCLMEAWGGHHHGLLFSGQKRKSVTVNPGYPHLRKWFSAIEFADPTYQANLYGWVLASLSRPVSDVFPFLVLDGLSRKVGKSTVAEAINYFLKGSNSSPITYTGDEREFEKLLGGSCGKPGPCLIFIDNVRPKRGQAKAVRAQILAVAATNACPSVRPNYGGGPIRLNYPVIIFTMNQAAVEHDLHDRVVRIVLGGEAGRYFNPHPHEYVKAYRNELLAEALDLLSKVSPGEEGFTQDSRFGQWERIATRAAALLGLKCDFNPDAVDTSDDLVKEVYSCIRDLCADCNIDRVPFTKFAEHVILHGAVLPELASVLRHARKTGIKGQSEVLRSLVFDLASRSLYSDGRAYEFKIERTDDHAPWTVRIAYKDPQPA